MMTPTSADACGIQGEVLLWPAAPVQRAGTDGGRPYRAQIQVEDRTGHVVAAVESDAGGRFLLQLAPGTYVLRPLSDVAAPRAPVQTVAVEPGRYTRVRITYDSGIR